MQQSEKALIWLRDHYVGTLASKVSRAQGQMDGEMIVSCLLHDAAIQAA